MNSNLYTHGSKVKISFKVLQYNVDQAMREEKVPSTKWNVRYPRIQKLINEVGADIVCLQEMRKLPDTISVNRFLASFDQYSYEIGYRNSNTLSFGQATLYKPEKFYPLQTVKKWLSDTPDMVSDTWAVKAGGTTGFGYLVLCTQFVHVEEGKIISNLPPFWVFNVHFGLEEELKTKSCYKLLDIVKNVAKDQEFLVCGDFNFFPDRDGDKQRAILTTEFKDLGKGAKTLLGKECKGTFIGYDHDEFKADLKNMVSRLDHIFSSSGVLGENAVLYTKTMLEVEPPELTTRDTPSDHLPLFITIKV